MAWMDAEKPYVERFKPGGERLLDHYNFYAEMPIWRSALGDYGHLPQRFDPFFQGWVSTEE